MTATNAQFLLWVEGVNDDGSLSAVINPRYLKDVLGVLDVSNNSLATCRPLRLRESGHAPYMDGDELRKDAAYQREIDSLDRMLGVANSEVRRLKAVAARAALKGEER